MASCASLLGARCPCAAPLEGFRGQTQPRPFDKETFSPVALSNSLRVAQQPRSLCLPVGGRRFNAGPTLQRPANGGLYLGFDIRSATGRSECRRALVTRSVRAGKKPSAAPKTSANELTPGWTSPKLPVKAPRTSVVAAALKEKEDTAKKDRLDFDEEPFWRLNEQWDIPWTGKTTVFTMTAWLIGFVLTGVVVPLGAVKLGYAPGDDADSKALFVLAYELAQTAIGLSIIWAFTKPFAPLGDELFKFDLKRPLARKDGWALYALGGFLLAFGAVQAAASATGVGQESGPSTRDAGDALMQLLPIIGASPLGTASLIVVTGVCAPLLEETVFRGFFLPSLTKWLPTWAAILISSFAFAAAHVTPGELPQLTALGLVLGLTYTQTRNLACPMLIHSLWNSGVIIVLTVLKVNGVDIKEFV